MHTRLLEAKDPILKANVTKAEVVEVGDRCLLLKTSAVLAGKQAISSADSDMVNQKDKAMVGDTVAGCVRIDVVSDNMLRIRYAEGKSVPENATHMVIGTPAAPTRCDITTADDKVEITTGALRLTAFLAPYRLLVTDLNGKKICGVGGPEKSFFCTWDSFNTGICRIVGQEQTLAVENFDLHADECIYGLGEKFIKLNKVGQTVDMNANDPCSVVSPRTYKNIPFYVSSHGYGVYFNHSSLMTYWVGSMTASDVQVAAEDDFLDYYIITGNIKEVISSYTDLTGKGVVPPKWTFGYWQSKISYSGADETLEVGRKLRENNIPCDVIHLDTHWFKGDWYCDLQMDKERFPDPAAYYKQMAEMGFKISLWQLPYIPEGSQLFDDLKAVDGFVKNADGSIYDVKICFTPGFKGIVAVIDYTNPEAVRIHQDYFRQLFRLGAKVIKTDFGECAPVDGVYHDGTPGHRMHNLYPLLYNKAIFEVTKEETGDGVVWGRSAWAGNQRYPLHWGGDNSPNYFNLIPQLEGGLSFGLSGFQFWSQDIGGFCGDIVEPLLIRWMQMGLFLSHSRIHGFGDREIYKYSPETIRVCRDYLQLRYRLMPYIFGSAMRCVEQSLPMARALVIEYQDDPNVWNLGNEYLFGESFLVAPIFDEGTHRRVYLPEGVWTDWWTKERIAGGRWIDVEANLETLPLYLREGAIVPMGPVMNYVDEIKTEQLDLLVSLFAGDGSTDFTIPVNDELIPVTYTAQDGIHTLTIGKTDVTVDVQAFGEGELKIVRA